MRSNLPGKPSKDPSATSETAFGDQKLQYSGNNFAVSRALRLFSPLCSARPVPSPRIEKSIFSQPLARAARKVSGNEKRATQRPAPKAADRSVAFAAQNEVL